MVQPVAGILLLAEAALAEPFVPLVVREQLGQIIEQAEWLREVIGDLLRSDEPSPVKAPIDLVRVVNDATSAEGLTYEGDLRLLWPAEPVLITVNHVMLRRIISNLLSNATRAAGPDGAVLLEIERHEGWAQLVVEDSGPGFGGIVQGLGLGLTAVARNVAESGGRFESGRSKLGGARLRLLLPLLPDLAQG